MKNLLIIAALFTSVVALSGCRGDDAVTGDYVFATIAGGSGTLGKIVDKDETFSYVKTCGGAIIQVYSGYTSRTNYTCESFKDK